MDLALFDLDETLICEDSTGLWLRWLVSQGFAPAALIDEERALMEQYYQGSLSMEAYMHTTLSPLAGMSAATVSGWIRRFIQRDILPRVYPAARERMRWHQQRGDTVIVISASGEHLVAPIAEQLGASGALAIGVEIIDDRYSGQTYGTMTYKEGKVSRLNDWLQQAQTPTYSRTWAYSDSINDLPMLEHADHAWVINPAEPLSLLAQQRGWEICHWLR
ncbi:MULTISPECIES: HAD family hydrolase [Erwinia]|uniref:Hydrolase n=1 Tax=Erwinia rhapontici TaxID=55212 RepID=A0ABM7MY59_ERWRD|nr:MULTISPECIES: HAD family hydrolase [Erwinia]NNS08445.1 HAD family hydrolase [Erwinia sp. JH02]BCQ34070.1 hydrolase [Erwinia rhapontici]BCQ38892.1 hydrolase [Erwinia rhapontici]BCQ44031.1 hydrolase [Erwinia rhapontici]